MESLYNIENFVMGKQTKESLKEYTCSACSKIAEDCSILDDSLFCKSCCDLQMEQKEPIKIEIDIDIEKRRIINKLMSKCINNGCDMIDQLFKMKLHNKDCKFKIISCNDCSESLMLKNYDEHKTVCLKRTVLCKYCESSCVFDSLKNHEDKICPKIIIICTNNDCTETYSRENQKQHEEECKFANIKCSSPGCYDILQRQFIQDHINNAKDEHYQKLLGHLSLMKEDIRILKNKNRRLTKSLEEKDKIIEQNKIKSTNPYTKEVYKHLVHNHMMTWLNDIPLTNKCNMCFDTLKTGYHHTTGGYKCINKDASDKYTCEHYWCENCVVKTYIPKNF